MSNLPRVKVTCGRLTASHTAHRYPTTTTPDISPQLSMSMKITQGGSVNATILAPISRGLDWYHVVPLHQCQAPVDGEGQPNSHEDVPVPWNH